MSFEAQILDDEFGGGRVVRLGRIGTTQTDKFTTHSYENSDTLKFGFQNINGEDYIVFQCVRKEFRLQRGDKISFLFDRGTVLNFPLEGNPVEVGGEVENRTRITLDELNTFQNMPFKKWKLTSARSKREVVGGFHFRLSDEGVRLIIQSMANAYKYFVEQHVTNYRPLVERKAEPDRRRIPQDVMDAVWRRDGGRCVQCGSQEGLEFDHIIPYSKGGANTYRNVQLLCEKCNGEKSDRIG